MAVRAGDPSTVCSRTLPAPPTTCTDTYAHKLKHIRCPTPSESFQGGWTCAHAAAEFGDVEALRILLVADANPAAVANVRTKAGRGEIEGLFL